MLKEERHMEKYKVILVDDEIEAIQAMEHKMDWDGLGFEVSGSATNGVKALELVENIQPDCCDNRYKNALYEWPGTGAEVK